MEDERIANINAHDAMRELTVMLIYLSRFSQGEKFDEATDFYVWKGYNFDILNELSDADYIRQGSHPAVHFRDKSAMTAQVGTETVINSISLL